MNKYKVTVYKTIVLEFSVDIYANSEEDIKKIVNNPIDFDTTSNIADLANDEHFKDSVYSNSDIDEWNWLLDAYDEDIIEETYELGKINQI
nr:MAG TPA: hypothetical protein [Caudoviricetes sp.]